MRFVLLLSSFFLLSFDASSTQISYFGDDGNGHLTYDVGYFSEEIGDRAGFELSLWAKLHSDYSFRISALALTGQNTYQESDLYTGFSIAGFSHFNLPLKPYIGGGLQYSNSAYCAFVGDEGGEDDWFEDKECINHKQAAFALYPEIGFSFNYNSSTDITIFARRYNYLEDHLSNTNAFGVVFSFSFGESVK